MLDWVRERKKRKWEIMKKRGVKTKLSKWIKWIYKDAINYIVRHNRWWEKFGTREQLREEGILSSTLLVIQTTASPNYRMRFCRWCRNNGRYRTGPTTHYESLGSKISETCYYTKKKENENSDCENDS